MKKKIIRFQNKFRKFQFLYLRIIRQIKYNLARLHIKVKSKNYLKNLILIFFFQLIIRNR